MTKTICSMHDDTGRCFVQQRLNAPDKWLSCGPGREAWIPRARTLGIYDSLCAAQDAHPDAELSEWIAEVGVDVK